MSLKDLGHKPEDEVDFIFLGPFSSSTLFPVQVVEPFRTTLLFWAGTHSLCHSCPGHALCHYVTWLSACQFMNHLCKSLFLFFCPFPWKKEIIRLLLLSSFFANQMQPWWEVRSNAASKLFLNDSGEGHCTYLLRQLCFTRPGRFLIQKQIQNPDEKHWLTTQRKKKTYPVHT